MLKRTHKVGLHRSSLLVRQKGLVLMVSLFLLFLLSLIAVSSVSVSRLGVYSSQSFVDAYVASPDCSEACVRCLGADDVIPDASCPDPSMDAVGG